MINFVLNLIIHTMKATKIFRQYIWLTNIIYHSRDGISLKEINERWVKTELSEGIPMTRLTFNRYRKAIEEIFDINIECKRKGYLYYIENDEILTNNSLKTWMIDSYAISNMLMESKSIKNRILLENIPSGRQHLSTIINAMKQGRKLLMEYQRFGKQEIRQSTIEPYAVKVFKQRWYLLAHNDKYETPAVYALDRIVYLKELDETFIYPQDFVAEDFFKDCYGVISGTKDKPQKIVIRAYTPYVNYLETLPLHTSQKELKSTPEYTDYEYFLRPTFDFRQELLCQVDEVEVLEPEVFRQEIKGMIQKMWEKYNE